MSMFEPGWWEKEQYKGKREEERKAADRKLRWKHFDEQEEFLDAAAMRIYGDPAGFGMVLTERTEDENDLKRHYQSSRHYTSARLNIEKGIPIPELRHEWMHNRANWRKVAVVAYHRVVQTQLSQAEKQAIAQIAIKRTIRKPRDATVAIRELRGYEDLSDPILYIYFGLSKDQMARLRWEIINYRALLIDQGRETNVVNVEEVLGRINRIRDEYMAIILGGS